MCVIMHSCYTHCSPASVRVSSWKSLTKGYGASNDTVTNKRLVVIVTGQGYTYIHDLLARVNYILSIPLLYCN